MKTKTKKPAPIQAPLEYLPTGHLVDAPYNPRKTFIQAEIDQMAGTMKTLGVTDALAVRKLPDDGGKKPRYEIISGHKRRRAAEQAGLEAVPCRVFDFDDLQARGACIVANIHSEPNPLETAAAYRELIDKHQLTTDKAAEFLGESVGGIRALLALKNLPEVAEWAVKEGILPVATAGLIARIPDETNRERLTLYVLDPGGFNPRTEAERREVFQPISYKETQDEISKNYMRQLKGVPWDTADAKLLPGAGSCKNCPTRAGNLAKEDPDTYASVRADMCLNVDCFKTKLSQHIARLKTQASERGLHVLDPYASRDIGMPGTPYVPLDAIGIGNMPGEVPLACTLRDYLKKKKIKLEKVFLAITEYGRSEEAVERSWLLRMLCPPAPSPHPSPAKHKQEKGTNGHKEGCTFEDELRTSAPPERPAEPQMKLCPQHATEARAASLALPVALNVIGNLVSGIVCSEVLTGVLRAAALAWIEREVDEFNAAGLQDMEKARGIQVAENCEDEPLLSAWKLWILGASAGALLKLLVETHLRWALLGLPNTDAGAAVLDAAGLNWDEFLAEAKAQAEPAQAVG